MFGRRSARKEQDAAAQEPTADATEGLAEAESQPAEPAEATSTGRYDRRQGPWDVSEVDDPGQGRVDLGGIWLPGVPGMELRVEVDQETQTVASIAVLLGELALQVQPFAAPRNGAEWTSIRGEIAASVQEQGGMTEEAEGPFGTELRAMVPAMLPDGTPGLNALRFVGVDGPRWFLRGVFSGPAVADPERSAPLEALFRDVVVVRGGTAMAPREPIPLTMPTQDEPAESGEAGDGEQALLQMPERGPEITEIR